jgi:TRAP-type mannitol/chloroaromatic compound transport system permease large subunit
VFARLGTADVVTNTMLALPLPPFAMLTIVIVLIFLLGWPFEWPAIILVFLPIFYPVIAALKYDMVWFGALVAVVMQTAFLSPPVAMSAYYLKQVVGEWSLGTIYKGMFQFMVLQCIAVALIMIFPQIATFLPEQMRTEAATEQTEPIDDSASRLEEDPLGQDREQTDESPGPPGATGDREKSAR